MKVAGYKDEDIERMDDISAFRRFFVISNLITEILGGMFGGMMGGNPDENMGETNYNSNRAERYGVDPFASPNMNREPPSTEEVNDIHNFPS